MNPTPRSRHSAANSRASPADAVVWSTSTAPALIPAIAPCGPSVTSRTSLSLPTHSATMSASSAASNGVGTAAPPFSATHANAFDAVRL